MPSAGPEDVLLLILGVLGLPAVLVTLVGYLLLLKDWVALAGSVARASNHVLWAGRSVLNKFLRVVVIQVAFVFITILAVRITVVTLRIGGNLEQNTLDSVLRAVMLETLSPTLDAATVWALAASLGFVGLADLTARYWQGVSPLGCVLSAGVLGAGGLAAAGAAYQLAQGTPDPYGAFMLITACSGLVLALWVWLMRAAADAPLDLIHELRVQNGQSSSTLS